MLASSPRQQYNQVWCHMRDQFPHPDTREVVHEWIASVDNRSPRTYFAIKAHREAVGSIGLILKSDVERCPTKIGYWPGEAAWGKWLQMHHDCKARRCGGHSAGTLRRMAKKTLEPA